MIKYASVIAFAILALLGPAGATADSDLNALINGYGLAEARLKTDADKQTDSTSEDTAIHLYVLELTRLNDGTRERLAKVDRSAFNSADQLTYDIFHWDLEDNADELKSGELAAFRLMPINQFDDTQITFPREIAQRGFGRARDYDDAVRRMLAFTNSMDTIIAKMRGSVKQGIVEPKIIVERLIAQVAAFADSDPEQSPFLAPLKNFAPSIGAPDRVRIEAAYRAAVTGDVLPAYRRLKDFLQNEYLPKARDSIGLSSLPGGKDIYLHLVKSGTTEDLSPDAVHALGLSELARIEIEMEAVKKETGFSGSLDQFRDFLRQDPQLHFKSQSAMAGEFARVEGVVESHLHQLFSSAPRTDLEFRFYEGFLAPDKPAAEYQAGQNDGLRPGIVYLNAFDLPSRPTYTSEVLELHEGIPGHHLQMDYVRSNRALSSFCRSEAPTAYLEGWGLYAETLGDQLGLYTDPYQKFGALSFDAWRASRLVVDTGIHWLGWTYDEAVDFLVKHTTLTRSEAEEEVDRYIAVPGQALGYKVGELEILSLRDEAKAALGPKFDIKNFHDAVLRDGAMPLSILKEKIESWIATQR